MYTIHINCHILWYNHRVEEPKLTQLKGTDIFEMMDSDQMIN